MNRIREFTDVELTAELSRRYAARAQGRQVRLLRESAMRSVLRKT